ncbi:hypothetical protein C923_05254 [Plasmodium falciparum UGT5.1]|uniref:Uncharacterized protein n=1 Tax=Plasmodium falciparum UGT5.1 TaxID=1237627 RepID=W7JH11_PLAFA|nr:hypothetical protein C923_05254 [Plasmodium falciparum UGT5.1]
MNILIHYSKFIYPARFTITLLLLLYNIYIYKCIKYSLPLQNVFQCSYKIIPYICLLLYNDKLYGNNNTLLYSLREYKK